MAQISFQFFFGPTTPSAGYFLEWQDRLGTITNRTLEPGQPSGSYLMDPPLVVENIGTLRFIIFDASSGEEIIAVLLTDIRMYNGSYLDYNTQTGLLRALAGGWEPASVEQDSFSNLAAVFR